MLSILTLTFLSLYRFIDNRYFSMRVKVSPVFLCEGENFRIHPYEASETFSNECRCLLTVSGIWNLHHKVRPLYYEEVPDGYKARLEHVRLPERPGQWTAPKRKPCSLRTCRMCFSRLAAQRLLTQVVFVSFGFWLRLTRVRVCSVFSLWSLLCYTSPQLFSLDCSLWFLKCKRSFLSLQVE